MTRKRLARKRLAHVLGLVSLLAPLTQPAAADRAEERTLFPGQGHLELRAALDVTHLVNRELTDFELQLAIGYFFTRWFQAGLGGGLGYVPPLATESLEDIESTGATVGAIGVRRQALTAGALTYHHDGGWYGDTNLWLRFFPFAASPDLLPYELAPFVHVQAGPRFSQASGPFLIASAAVGLNIYVTEQLAFAPQVGYALIYATDDRVQFDRSAIEHALAASWSVSLFFLP